ncbi:hypothetical protein AX16_004325 [Volvariella volvacea WC 439]|nr:hypothetical protein AX16_004325 [Volvariella volvacea WC 439]
MARSRPMSNFETRRNRRFSMKEQNLYIFRKTTLIICSCSLCITIIFLALTFVDKMGVPFFYLKWILAVGTMLFLGVAIWSRRKDRRRNWAVRDIPLGLGGLAAPQTPASAWVPRRESSDSQDTSGSPISIVPQTFSRNSVTRSLGKSLRGSWASAKTYKQPKILLFNEIFAYLLSVLWLAPLVLIVVATIPSSPLRDVILPPKAPAAQGTLAAHEQLRQEASRMAMLVVQGVGATLNFLLLGAFAILLSIERRRNDRSRDDALYMEFVIE